MPKEDSINIADLKKLYADGNNIIAHLNSKESSCMTPQEIIEIAYDIQSGSYTKKALSEMERLNIYAKEIFRMAGPLIAPNDVILDCGAGEITTLSALTAFLPPSIELIACDISLSRLRYGRKFADSYMKEGLAKKLKLFVGDMLNLPLPDNSVDVVLTTHALEPNHGSEKMILSELLRVSRKRLILFEPSWENASDQIRKRMKKHGYIRNLPQTISELGCELVSTRALSFSLNENNPTYCYVIEKERRSRSNSNLFACPKTGNVLHNKNGYLYSDGGWAYPVIEDIPCLRANNAILMSHQF